MLGVGLGQGEELGVGLRQGGEELVEGLGQGSRTSVINL